MIRTYRKWSRVNLFHLTFIKKYDIILLENRKEDFLWEELLA